MKKLNGLIPIVILVIFVQPITSFNILTPPFLNGRVWACSRASTSRMASISGKGQEFDDTTGKYMEKKLFKRFMQIQLWRSPELESLFPVLCSLELACRDINRLMRRVSTDNLDGYNGKGANTMNIQGEDQKKLDVIANRIMKITLCCSGQLQSVASEEEDEPCLCSAVADNSAFSGDYAAVFDPLDGSSNVDSGLPTGTIFGIYKAPKFGGNKTDSLSILKQKGSELVVAGYCLYSASTHMVITLRTGLHMFTLDDITGEFYLTRSNIRIPRSGNIFSFNDAYSPNWPNYVNYFVQDFKSTSNKKPTARYMGALVADTHNILLNGGIFGYPETKSKPRGKLRLLYEANPIALVFEEAGGLASNGLSRILDLPVADIHQRTPFYVGSFEDIVMLEKYHKFYL